MTYFIDGLTLQLKSSALKNCKQGEQSDNIKWISLHAIKYILKCICIYTQYHHSYKKPTNMDRNNTTTKERILYSFQIFKILPDITSFETKKTDSASKWLANTQIKVFGIQILCALLHSTYLPLSQHKDASKVKI